MMDPTVPPAMLALPTVNVLVPASNVSLVVSAAPMDLVLASTSMPPIPIAIV